MRCTTTAWIVVLGLLFGMSGRALAGEADTSLALAGDLGLGGLSGKAYATLESGIEVRERHLALGLFGRVRLRLQDVPGEGRVRDRDWDEATDFVHLLRYVQYRRVFGAVTLEAQEGELPSFTLGHGTLVREYSNVADPDHPHSAVRLRVEGKRLLGEAMVDNILRPAVVAFRVEGQPAASLRAFRIGASAVVDPTAPVAVRRGLAGERLVDSAWNLQSETEALGLLGVDAEYTLGDGDKVRVTPYADLNSSLHGIGLHAGASGRFLLGNSRTYIGGQVEYRLSSGGYSPVHIGTFYDLERLQAGLASSDPASAREEYAAPKLAGLERGVYGGHGALAEVGLEMDRRVRLKVGCSHRPGPDATSLWLRAATSPIERLDLGLLLVGRGLGDAEGSAQGLAALAEGRWRITDTLYALAQYTRIWSLDSGSRYFGILQSFNLALGATWSG